MGKGEGGGEEEEEEEEATLCFPPLALVSRR